MITVCFLIVAIYFLLVLVHCWNETSTGASEARFFGVVLLAVAIFGIIAVNGGFTFTTDLQEIRRRAISKE